MKRLLLVAGLLLWLLSTGSAQSIQYSKGSFHNDNPNDAQLVSNIEGYHHIVSFTYSKKPIINIFDEKLRLISQKQLDYPIRKDCDVKILRFATYYYITLHVFRPSYYEVWKVDRMGNALKLSANLQAVVDTSFRMRSPALQFFEVCGNLYAFAQSYFDSLKTVRCKVVQLDSNMNVIRKTTLFYPFDRETELLQQTSLSNEALLVLKSSRDEFGNALYMMKVDLETGDAVTTSFSTGAQLNVNPSFVTTEKDSSVLVYSTLMQTNANRTVQRTVFITRLDGQLKERTPVTLLKHQFNSNTFSNFLFLQGDPSLWLNITGNRRLIGASYPQTQSMPPPGGINSLPTVYNYVPSYGYKGPTGVRFTVVDKQFKRTSDTLVANDKKLIEVQSYPFGQFTLNDQAHLVLIQNYTPKRKGLVMLTGDDKNRLSVTELSVYDRYDFMLSQLQSFDRNFLVPYAYKNEMGLMKVTIKEDDLNRE